MAFLWILSISRHISLLGDMLILLVRMWLKPSTVLPILCIPSRWLLVCQKFSQHLLCVSTQVRPVWDSLLMDFSKRREERKLQCLHIDHSNSEWEVQALVVTSGRTLPAWTRGRFPVGNFPAFLVDSGPWTGLERCDVVLYNKCVFGLWPLFQHRAPKILGISLEESDQVSLAMLMRWLLLTLETGCQEDRVCNWRVGLSVPPPTSEGRRGWRLSLWPMANDALNHNYVVKHLKTQKVQRLESFWFGECTGIWGKWSLSMEAPCPFPMPCPLHLFHLALPVCACGQKPPILLRLHRL